MKYSIIFAALIFTCLIFISDAKAQNLTWNELKQVQKEERTELANTQKEMLGKLLSAQTEEINILKREGSSTSNDILMLIDKHIQERKEVSKAFSDERAKLAQIQTEERKFFMQNKNKEK